MFRAEGDVCFLKRPLLGNKATSGDESMENLLFLTGRILHIEILVMGWRPTNTNGVPTTTKIMAEVPIDMKQIREWDFAEQVDK